MSGEYIVSPTDRILVTGSNGFIGTSVVENLLALGFSKLRFFVRPSSKLDRLKKILEKYPAGKNAEIIAGDLLSREDCKNAARDVAVIIHLAAGFEKSFAGAFMNSALATRIMLALGAGIYEELLFRVILVSGISAIAERLLGWQRTTAGIVAVIISATIFSAFHYIGPYGDPLRLDSFLFRALGGVAFSVVYLLRGFGITAWTHALYDVLVLTA